MTKRYTAADFANARFAEHPAGGRGHRIGPNEWRLSDSTWRFSTEEIILDGWVPVPTKPTIEFTESEVEVIGRDAINYFKPGGTWADWARAVFMSADFPIIPDPEPTNTDRLEQLIRESGLTISDNGIEGYAAELATSLNEDGVTAPNAKGN